GVGRVYTSLLRWRMSVTFRVQKLISSLESSKPSVKYDAVKALRTISERAPHAVYPHFDLFVNYLRHENSILRWNAMLILANLASVDDEGQLDEILDDYLAAINGCRMIDAANTIRGAAVIACAKPYLADTIASRIMQVEHANYATPECRNVGIGHAIEALGRIRPK